MIYKIRVKCTHDGTWHYIYEEQGTIDQNITCTEHPSSIISDFVIIDTDIE